MTQGGPGNATNLLSMYLYRQLFNFSNVGAGSAIAVILGLIAFGIGLMFVRFLYRPSPCTGGPVDDGACRPGRRPARATAARPAPPGPAAHSRPLHCVRALRGLG